MFSSNGTHGDKEEALVLAALQRSPTYDTALFRNDVEHKQVRDKLVSMMNGDIEGVSEGLGRYLMLSAWNFPKLRLDSRI